MTKNEALRTATNEFLASLPEGSSIDSVEGELLEAIHLNFNRHNSVCDKGSRWRLPESLPNFCIAQIILHFYEVRRLRWDNGATNPLLAVYHDSGEDKGLYVEDDNFISRIVHRLNCTATSRDVQEVIFILNDEAAVVPVTRDKDLIAVNNGVFNYRTKTLMPFSPEYVFTAKSRVDYIAGRKKPVIHNDEDGTDWDVESWLDEVASGDHEVVELLWQMLGAVIRPHVRWDKMVWLYSRKGMNGKGTFCELLKQLCGEGAFASIPLNAFERDFLLEELLHCTAIITDENPTSEFSKNPATLKSIITGDTFQINRKNKTAITIRFSGLVVECINELPRFGDTTESLYRRILCIPFNQTFVGCERKYIKHDYMHRKDVLEYVLCKVLNMDYYEFSEPQSCKEALDEYKIVNDTVGQFVAEMLPQCVWELLPWSFLYDLYIGWLKKENPSSHALSKTVFMQRVRQVIDDRYAKEYEYRDKPYTTRNHMNGSDPLIAEYNLINWMDRSYSGSEWYRRCSPPLKQSYRGLMKK